jgi:hypothetical protein
MKHRTRLLAMQQSLTEVLPCDTAVPQDTWFSLYDMRLRDLGYDEGARHTQSDMLRRKVALRDEAREQLTSILTAKCKSTEPEMHALVLYALSDTKIYLGLHKDRNFARYAKHLRYIKDHPKWRLTFSSYRGLFTRAITGRAAAYRPILPMLHNAPLDDVKAFVDVFEYTYWSATPDVRTSYQCFPTRDMLRCPISGDMFPANYGVNVITSSGAAAQRVHPAVAHDSTRVRRDVSGLFVLIEAVTWVQLEDGGFAWRERNEHNGLIYQDEDTGAWRVSNPNSRIGSYHGAHREWRGARSGTFVGCIGVELECGWKSHDHLRRFVRRFVNENGHFHSGRPFLIESDSSLSSVPNGVEIISEPLPLYAGYQAEDAPWRWLLSVLSQSGCEGWAHRRYAGIHVNMDASNRTASEITRYVLFLHNIPAIAKFVSGRTHIYGASPSATPATDSILDNFTQFSNRTHFDGGFVHYTPEILAQMQGLRSPVTKFTGDTLAVIRNIGKYQPVNVRSGGVLETRIFGANIRYTGFMACVELCVAGMEFVRELEDDTEVFNPELSTQFRSWLNDHSEKYPNLIARIGALETPTKPAVAARPLVEFIA